MSIFKTIVMVFGGLAVLSGGVGCQSGSAPRAQVEQARFGERSDEAMLVHLDVTLENPNVEPLGLLEMEYDVVLNGTSVYHGRRSAEAVIPAGGSSQLTIPAVIRFDRYPWAAELGPSSDVTWSVRGDLTYLAADRLAEILFDAGVRTPTTGFGGDGTIE